MPHCQKENHNHASKSKKDRLKAKQEAQARKQRLREAAAAAEAEAALKLSNNIAPVEGHGEYEVGYEPEPEYTRFNVKKRSKKHLRNDLRKRMLREQREEEERVRRAQEEEYRKQQEELRKQQQQEDDEESEPEEAEPPLEYFVFICECCDKRYATKNQFLNHIHSKKHKRKCRIYEDLGLLVTHIELRGENGNEKQVYNDDDDDDDEEEDEEEDSNRNGTKTKPSSPKPNSGGGSSSSSNNNNSNDSDDDNNSEERSESESDDDEYYAAPSRSRNAFAGFAAGFGDDSSSSEEEDSDDDGDDDGDDGDETRKPRAAPPKVEDASDEDDEDDESDIDFDELIRQNQLLQEELDAQRKEGDDGKELAVPLPFHETYDPDDYDANEQRLVSVKHRLRKNLASRGIAPATRAPGDSYDPLDAIAMGKTLLQQVLESSIDTLQQRLEAYRRHKKHCELVAREFALAGGNSKALPAQYIHKQDPADNARFRANVHHAGSHYHMQMARSMQFGRHKGMMARHSSQGARLQASRMAARAENARLAGGGAKIGKKTSKKSQQKRRGEAGGSKKTGGYKGGDGGD